MYMCSRVCHDIKKSYGFYLYFGNIYQNQLKKMIFFFCYLPPFYHDKNFFHPFLAIFAKREEF